MREREVREDMSGNEKRREDRIREEKRREERERESWVDGDRKPPSSL